MHCKSCLGLIGTDNTKKKERRKLYSLLFCGDGDDDGIGMMWHEWCQVCCFKTNGVHRTSHYRIVRFQLCFFFLRHNERAFTLCTISNEQRTRIEGQKEKSRDKGEPKRRIRKETNQRRQCLIRSVLRKNLSVSWDMFHRCRH